MLKKCLIGFAAATMTMTMAATPAEARHRLQALQAVVR